MERRNFLRSAAVAGLSGSLLTSCTSNSTAQQNDDVSPDLRSGIVLHSVYFWLKEDISEEEEEDFLNFFEALREVPGVQTLHYGKPAPTTPRPVVDNSFQYNLVVTFSSMEDIETYETHPDHIAAAERYSKYWVKVEVRDTIIE